MKAQNFLFFAFLIISLIGLFVLTYYDQPKEKSIIITTHTTYSYLYNEHNHIKIPLYVNHKASPLKAADYYEDLYLTSDNGTKKLSLDLNHIVLSHMESYLNMVYQQVILVIDMPYLGENIALMDATLHIVLVTGDYYELKIGDFVLAYKSHQQINRIEMTSLYGLKDDSKALPRLQQIHLYHELFNHQIDYITLGVHLNVTHEIKEGLIIIHIPFEASILYDVPIIIHYTDGVCDYFDNFLYMINYEVLKESGPLLHVLTVD